MRRSWNCSFCLRWYICNGTNRPSRDCVLTAANVRCFSDLGCMVATHSELHSLLRETLILEILSIAQGKEVKGARERVLMGKEPGSCITDTHYWINLCMLRISRQKWKNCWSGQQHFIAAVATHV